MGQIQSGQQSTVDEAAQSTDSQTSDDQQQGIGDTELLNKNTDGAGAKHTVGTDGKVDTSGDQGAQHTGCDQAVDGCLLEDVHDVADPRELIGHGDAENDHQDGQRHHRAELLHDVLNGQFLCFGIHISLTLLPRRLS